MAKAKTAGVAPQPVLTCCRILAVFYPEHMEVRGQRLDVKLPHHQCDLTSMGNGMVRQMLH
jgi:hypothetical protein